MRNLFGIPLPERKGMKKGGSAIPRNTVIANQPHHLAYINKEEDKMLRDAGGSGQPGPGGVPAYPDYDDSTGGGFVITAAAVRVLLAVRMMLMTASRRVLRGTMLLLKLWRI